MRRAGGRPGRVPRPPRLGHGRHPDQRPPQRLLPGRSRGRWPARIAELVADEDVWAVVGYDVNGTYGHPDHLQVHRVAHTVAPGLGVPWLLDATYNREYLASLPDSDGTARPRPTPRPVADLTHFVQGEEWFRAKMEGIKCHRSQGTRPRPKDRPRRTIDGWRTRFGTEWFIVRSPTGATDLGALAEVLEPKEAWPGPLTHPEPLGRLTVWRIGRDYRTVESLRQFDSQRRRKAAPGWRSGRRDWPNSFWRRGPGAYSVWTRPRSWRTGTTPSMKSTKVPGGGGVHQVEAVDPDVEERLHVVGHLLGRADGELAGHVAAGQVAQGAGAGRGRVDRAALTRPWTPS